MVQQATTPPWLQRHKEMLKLVETVKKLKTIYIYTSDEIISIVGERYRRLRPRRPGPRGRIEFELKRLETVYNVARSRLQAALQMPRLNDMSSFHRALVESFVGAEEYENALARIRNAVRLMKSFWDEYRLLIVSSNDPREAAQLRRKGSGRILSLVRRRRRDLELLRRVREELLKTHVISEGLPVVVVAGIPSAGKSTLVSRLSTAEPEIAAYPFTTKNVIVGKVEGYPSFYIVDTPGILERKSEYHNEIERKALAALKTLPDIVLFLIDPSMEKIQSIDEQLDLLADVLETIVRPWNRGLIIALNKHDIAPREEVKRAISGALEVVRAKKLEDRLCGEPIPISASTGEGLGKLMETTRTCLKRYATWLFAK